MENNDTNFSGDLQSKTVQVPLLHYYFLRTVSFVSLVIILGLILRKVSNYYFKMMCFNLTILFATGLSSVVNIVLYFFGDTTKFVFDTLYYSSLWTGIKCDVRNKEILELERPYVLIINHQSALDTFILSNFWPNKCAVMMKSSLRYVPVFGFSAMLSHSIFVDRHNHESAVKSLENCAKVIKTKKVSVAIFPEGTRNHGDGILPFKKGAFNIAVQTQIPIVPCVISSYKNFYSKQKQYFHDSGYVIVELMDPVLTYQRSMDDVPELAERVRDDMIEVYERISKEVEQHQNENIVAKKVE